MGPQDARGGGEISPLPPLAALLGVATINFGKTGENVVNSPIYLGNLPFPSAFLNMIPAFSPRILLAVITCGSNGDSVNDPIQGV